MSRYPGVVLFCFEQYVAEVNAFICDNKAALNCSVHVTSNLAELTNMWDPGNAILVTYGPDNKQYILPVRSVLPERFCTRWLHYSPGQFIASNAAEVSRGINFCFINNVIGAPGTAAREHLRPVFSAFTTCYNSYNKIKRMYASLKVQTMLDWELVVMDDSPQSADDVDPHFQFLKKVFAGDARVRLYNRSNNSGNIGNVKNEAISLCRGKYVLELDHDDEITPDCFAEATHVFESDPGIGFVYSDFTNVYENGNNFSYVDFYGLGYAGYYCQKWLQPTEDVTKFWNRWINTSVTPQVNNVTLSHLVSLPNHPRMWRRTVLQSMGNYSEMLPICDDQEILMRTAITTKMAKINKMCYVQYMNDGGNNFSLIRNAEINRIGPRDLCSQFYEKYNVYHEFAKRGGSEPVEYRNNCSPIWKRDPLTYAPTFINKSFAGRAIAHQVCVIGLDTLLNGNNEDGSISSQVIQMLQTGDHDIIVLDGTVTREVMCQQMDKWIAANDSAKYNGALDRVKCYAMVDTSPDELVKYFFWVYKSGNTDYKLFGGNRKLAHMLYCKTPGVICGRDSTDVIDNPTSSFIATCSSRSQVINANITISHKYAEIGVEYGTTFREVNSHNKTAIDPDPKFTIPDGSVAERMFNLTSDVFFDYAREHGEKYDAICIDGMHQSEYVLRDVQNATECVCGYFSDEHASVVYEDMLDSSTTGISADMWEEGSFDENNIIDEIDRVRFVDVGTRNRERMNKQLIFIDDVLPLTESEQHKIPTKHYYENGILKYGEPWTGDVWKVIYHMLLMQRETKRNRWFTYKVYTHPSYRGVIAMKIKRPFVFSEGAIEKINAYTWSDHFSDYKQMLLLGQSSNAN